MNGQAPRRAVLGIDLGTTNSVVASIDDDGNVVIVRNAVGAELTPSVVYFEPDGSAVVGDEALQATLTDPGNVISLVKRHMGTEFPMVLRGNDHTPESISALILRSIAGVASNDAGAAPRVVITVPAYFGLAEREATYQAGLIAGLDVLELLDEPVAAAAHYGMITGGDRTVLVYDLGGGTFDTTVLRISAGAVRVVATDGHHSLGGADIDQRLLDVALAQLERRMPRDELDELTDDQRLLGELTLSVEAAKRDLSATMSREILVRAPRGRYPVSLARSDLEAVCGDLFDTTSDIIDRVLRTARAEGAGSVDEVIMVGGSSRIPLLSERLRATLGTTPRLVEPDLAVAKGAALRAHHLAGTAALTMLTSAPGRRAGARIGSVTPVTPRAVGILVQDSHDPLGERNFVDHIVPANTPLPATRTASRFGTILANQQSVRVQVYEQAGSVLSAEVSHNRRVLDGELTGIGSLPACSVIEITVSIAIDGRLTVVAHEPVSGRELTLEAFVEGVVDTADTERLTRIVGMTTVRG